MDFNNEMFKEIKELRQQENDELVNLLVKYEIEYLANKDKMGGIREHYVSVIKNKTNNYTALENLIIKKYAVKSLLNEVSEVA